MSSTTTYVPQDVAAFLKELRSRSKLTIRQVSENMGSSSPNAYGAYEQGKRRPSVPTLEKILAALGFDLLLSSDGETYFFIAVPKEKS